MGQNRNYHIGFFIVAVAIASVVGINQYHYAMWNQFISLPWLYEIVNPELYQNDLLVNQYTYSPTFFLYTLAALLPVFGNNIAVMFFITYLLILLFTIYSFYRLGEGIFGDKRSGVLAVVLLSFSFPVIGDVSLWDSLLMERTVALPFLLLSIYTSYSKKYWLTIVLQSLAFNMHPLSAAYIIALTWFSVLISEGYKKDYFLFAATLIILISPALYLRLSVIGDANPGPELRATWMEAMRLRNGHHTFPTEFPLLIFAKSALIAFTYFLLVLKGGFKKQHKNYLLAFGAATLFMLLLGTVFTELYPVKLIIQIQFFRAYLFLVFLTIVLWVGLIINRPRPVFYLLALPIIAQYFYGEWAKTGGLLMMAGGAWFLMRFFGSKPKPILILSAGFLVLGFGAMTLRGGINIAEGKQEADWYALQDWFNTNTDMNSLAIVPPSESGFRVRSRRASYGDWFDGTKAFFSESYAEYWLSHMRRLGCTDPKTLKEDYRKLSEQDFQSIWEEEQSKFSDAYVVHYADTKLGSLECVFKNDRFAVFRLP